MHRQRLALIILFAVANTILLAFSPFWYLQAAFTVFFYLIALAHLMRDLDIFYVLCAGEPPVILAGIQQPWVGIALQLLLLSILADGAGILQNARDAAAFMVFCLVAAGISAGVLVMRQILFPLVILAIAALAAVAFCFLAEYRYTAPFRRRIS